MKQGEYAIGRILPHETWALRAAVLWPEKKEGPECAMSMDGDSGVFHVGARIAGQVVCTSTFMPDRHPGLPEEISYRLRAMATHPEHRNQGLGKVVLEHALRDLEEMGCGGVWADARHIALGFYACLGWDVSGPSYEVTLRGLHRLVWRRTGVAINR